MARSRNDGRGISLAKGPVAIVGVILVAFAILALVTGSTQFSAHVPKGPVSGNKILGFELNGWSMLLTGAAGLLLLFGSPMHFAAKSLSLIVGLVLGAAAIIAVAEGAHKGVFGIFAANHATEIGWGIAAVVLIVLSLLPRVGGGRERGDDAYDDDAGRGRRGVERERPDSETPARRRLRDRV